jgi:hypothetical protein
LVEEYSQSKGNSSLLEKENQTLWSEKIVTNPE